MKKDKFINIELTKETIDIYQTRKSIFESLNDSLPSFKGKLLDVGCGKLAYKEHIINNSSITDYVGLEIESSLNYKGINTPDKFWDGINMPFKDNSFDTIIAMEVLEHCPDINIILSEINRVLTPGGVFYFTVPFLWNLHEVPNDEYRYTPFSLERHLRYNNFSNIQIKAQGGWNAALAQMMGLWARRSLFGRRKKIISFIFKPIIKYLLKKDQKPIDFADGTMITALYGTTSKTSNT